MLKILLYTTLLISSHASLSQKPFEGIITYTNGAEGNFKMGATYYFAPGKLRIDLHVPLFANEKRDSSTTMTQLFDLDSNFIYFFDHGTKRVQKIIIDTLLPASDETGKKVLSEVKTIKGYACYGIEYSTDEEMEVGDSAISISGKHINWYAKDLSVSLIPRHPGLFNLMINDRKICLMTESSMIFGKDTTEKEIDLIAGSIEPGKPDHSFFVLPAGYGYSTHNLSKLLTDTSLYNIQKIELTEIRQEEEKVIPPPPPPPPPKKPVKSTDATKKNIKKQD